MLQKLYPKSRIGHPAPCLWVPVPDTNRRPRDQKTKRQWITYGILINIRPRDQKTERPVWCVTYRTPHPQPWGRGRGRGKQHLEQAPLYPKEKLKKEVLCFSQILYRVFHSIVLQIRCFSIVSAREGRYDLFNHLKSDLKWFVKR